MRFTRPAGFDAASPRQADGSAASSSNSDALLSGAIVLSPGQYNTSIDAGFYRYASLGDRVWLDTDGDGQQDAGEPGMAGVTVQLRDATNGAVVATTTTNAQGNYLFSNLLPGYYGVQLVMPTGYVVTESDAGGSGTSSSAVGGGYVLASGQAVTDADGGFYRLASLGDRLWLDANGDGRQDAGEVGIAGQTVTLVRGGADRVVGTADDSTVSTTTDAGGYYRFTGLMPGAECQVVFAKPEGSVFTARDSGDDLADSDADADGASQVVTLASGDVSALLRHSAAALLNASNPNVSYLYSAAQVVAMVKQAFATGSYEATKNLFAAQNELGADLGSGGGTTRVVTEDVDADTAADALLVPAGAEAVYTYVLKNTGSVALDDVSVSDDHLSALAFAGGDANGDGRLDVGETWTYIARETVAAGAQIAGTAIATGHGAALGTVASDSDATHVNATAPGPSPEERVALSFDFSGSGPIDGADSNTRSYSMDGVSVTASAFSRDKSGQWAQAYLGVTDASENGSGQTYTVDNSGRDNYLVFQFSSNVVVDEAFLGAVVGDSDLTAWIGSSATPLTSLSDALLAGLAREESDGGAAARWADLNAAGREGNLLVIAASVKGGKADDQFLLDQLGVTAAAVTDDLLGLLGTLPQHAAVY